MMKSGTLYLSIYSLIILLFILIDAHHGRQKERFDYKIFMSIIISNICLIIIEILSWAFTAKPGFLNLLLNSTFNLLLYIGNPIVGVFWVNYSDFMIFHSELRIKLLRYPLWGVFIINAAIAIISLRTGWYFVISDNNIYNRGDYYLLHMGIVYLYLLYAFVFTALNIRMVQRKYFINMILFTIIPMVGGLLQAKFYGLSLGWSSICLSILIFYFSTQNKALSTDYLTGAYNRRHLDYYINQKVRGSTKNKTFSAILIDINNFKQINDEFGHDVGDDALKTTVTAIKKVLKNSDFIARFGGDEFYIVLETDDPILLKEMVNKINKSVEDLNSEDTKPYKLSFSMGYDVYDYSSAKSPDEFLKYIDRLMYDNKNNRSHNE